MILKMMSRWKYQGSEYEMMDYFYPQDMTRLNEARKVNEYFRDNAQDVELYGVMNKTLVYKGYRYYTVIDSLVFMREVER